MRNPGKGIAVALAAAVVLGAAGAAWSQDMAAILKQRQATMKRMSGDLKVIREYGQEKTSQERAVGAAMDVAQTLPNLPALFPKGSGMAEFPGKSGAKPGIWTEWDKFLGYQQNAEEMAKRLLAAVKEGNRAEAASGPGDLWNNGCQDCHKPFRAKI
jgi:cytochrome c556